MGVKGLLKVLAQHMKRVHIASFSGQRVAVDASTWLHRGAVACARALVLSRDGGNTPRAHIHYCLRMLHMLVTSAGVAHVVLVFDGARLPAKSVTHLEREEERQRALSTLLALEAASGSPPQSAYMPAVDITPEDAHMLRELIKLDEKLNAVVECITAPYEADAQIAYLCRTKYVDLAISEDSDLIVYGAPKILFKMDGKGNGDLLDVEALVTGAVYDDGRRIMAWNHGLLLGLAALGGCDYLKSLPGMGVQRALSYVLEYGSIDAALKPILENHIPTDKLLCDIVKSVGLDPSLAGLNKKTNAGQSDPQQKPAEPLSAFTRFTCYRAAIYRCRLVYMHQHVYDPVTGKCVPGLPLPDTPSQLAQLAVLAHFDTRLLRNVDGASSSLLLSEIYRTLIGEPVSDGEIRRIALGMVHPETKVPFTTPLQLKPYKYDYTDGMDNKLPDTEPAEAAAVHWDSKVSIEYVDQQQFETKGNEWRNRRLTKMSKAQTPPSNSAQSLLERKVAEVLSPVLLGQRRNPVPFEDTCQDKVRKRLRQVSKFHDHECDRSHIQSAAYSEPAGNVAPIRCNNASVQFHNEKENVLYAKDESLARVNTESARPISIVKSGNREAYLLQMKRLAGEISVSQQQEELPPTESTAGNVTKPLDITSPIPKWVKRMRVPFSAPHRKEVARIRSSAVTALSTHDLFQSTTHESSDTAAERTSRMSILCTASETSGTDSSQLASKPMQPPQVTLFSVSPTRGSTVCLALELDQREVDRGARHRTMLEKLSWSPDMGDETDYSADWRLEFDPGFLDQDEANHIDDFDKPLQFKVPGRGSGTQLQRKFKLQPFGE